MSDQDGHRTGSVAHAATADEVADLVHSAARIRQSVETVIEGKHAAVQTALTVLLAEGHLLLEDADPSSVGVLGDAPTAG